MKERETDTPINVLVVGTEADDRSQVRSLFNQAGTDRYEVEFASTYEDGIAAINDGRPDVVLVASEIGQGSAVEFITESGALERLVPIIVVSTGTADDDVDAVRAGASYVLAVRGLSATHLKRAIAFSLERQRLLEQLNYERDLLRALLDSIPEAVYFKDADSRFVRVSRRVAEMFGLDDPADVAGKTDFDFFTEQHAKEALADEQALLKSEVTVISKEEMETWPSGRISWAQTSKSPLRNRAGKIIGTLGVSQDITAKMRREFELREAKEAAESASRAKSEFVARMSHEIRTPLGVIIGMGEVLRDTDLDDSQRDYLSMVADSAESLLEIVNEVLDFSKIEANKLDVVAEPVEVRSLFEDVLKPYVHRAKAKGLGFQSVIGDSVPERVVVDPGRLRQIIVNLVGNAIKFTPSGEIALAVEWSSEPDSGPLLNVAVTDTGIGIPPESLNDIFSPFEQVDSSTTRSYRGTGLGLSISSRIVELMGGEMSVNSEEGQGSTFRFSIRAPRPETEGGRESSSDVAPGIEVTELPSGLRGLIVDDLAENRRLAQAMLAGHSLTADCVSSGAEALAALEARSYDFVLMDIEMPETNGLETTRSLRERERGRGRHTPVIAMTAHAMTGDRERCLDAGMDAYVSVPLRSDALIEAIAKALESRGTGGGSHI